MLTTIVMMIESEAMAAMYCVILNSFNGSD